MFGMMGTYNWYYYQPSGAMAHGWQAIGGIWYYLHLTDGHMYDNAFVDIDGQSYYFSPGGAMHTGWKKYDRHDGTYDWYYYQTNGAEAYGWQAIDGHWYYFHPTLGGWMTYDGIWDIEGEYYGFGPDGAMLTGWNVFYGTYYFFGSDGKAHTGWLYRDGAWYYYDEIYMYKNLSCVYVDGKVYSFAADGKMITGWHEWKGRKYYFNSDGSMYRGWLTYNNNRYYLSLLDGQMYCNGTYKIDGEFMTFDADGKLILSK